MINDNTNKSKDNSLNDEMSFYDKINEIANDTNFLPHTNENINKVNFSDKINDLTGINRVSENSSMQDPITNKISQNIEQNIINDIKENYNSGISTETKSEITSSISDQLKQIETQNMSDTSIENSNEEPLEKKIGLFKKIKNLFSRKKEKEISDNDKNTVTQTEEHQAVTQELTDDNKKVTEIEQQEKPIIETIIQNEKNPFDVYNIVGESQINSAQMNGEEKIYNYDESKYERLEPNFGKEDFIEFKDVCKSYKMGETTINALKNVNFSITERELVVILGASGSGKSTALNILGGIDDATTGSVIVDGIDVTKLSQEELTEYRRNDIGFIFQFYNLVPNLTTLENVELATEICKNPLDPKEILKKVGLEERITNFPGQLSGGEQQRTAIARAIAKNPKILLCDEPTGALDYKIGKQILKLLQETCRKENMTVIIITHNSAIAPMADKVIQFKSGEVINIKTNDKPVPVEVLEW